MQILAVSVVIAAITGVPHAFAFHVPEHVAITQRAVSGLQKCGLLPRSWESDWTAEVVKADENEDYDLFRKWSKYSHYYNPNHPIDQARADSSLTVKESVAAIRANPHDVVAVNGLIGRIIHHVQDAAVPAHAIPIAHSTSDGFEVYDVSRFYAQPASVDECTQLAAVEPIDALHDSAIATLAALEQPVRFTREGFAKKLPWLGSFWSLGEGNAFGAYGPLGDNFGSASFQLEDGRTVVVDASQYEQFKRAQAALAVRATQRVILWANRVRGL